MNKYHNIKTVVDGITFDSKLEAKRYGELKLLEKGNLIFGLELQPKFPIVVNGKKICTYIADFKYILKTSQPQGVGSEEIIEDVKGMKTPIYNLKKKLMKAIHGIDIVEITK